MTLVPIESLILGVANDNGRRRKRSLNYLNTMRDENAGKTIPVEGH